MPAAPSVPPLTFPPDPVIEAFKRDVDVSLLRENLKRTPEQRIQAIISMNELVHQMRLAKRPPRAL